MSTHAPWTARHRRGVIAAWSLAIVGLGAAAMVTGPAFSDVTDIPESESTRAMELIASVSDTDSSNGTIVWHVEDGSATDPAVMSETSTMLTEVSAVDGVVAVLSPYSEGGGGQVSADGTTAYATVVATDEVDISEVREVLAEHRTSTLEIESGGTALTEQPGGEHGPEGVGMIAALVLLYVMFRARRAAFLPLLTGIAGVASSLLAVTLAAHVISIPADALTMGALIGLGVGIDYSLFVVNRHRRGLMAGRSTGESLRTALSTSGRAVVFAGATVMIALAGMFLLQMPILTAMALCAAITVACTVLAAVTLLPALLAVMGTAALSRRQRAQLAADGRVDAPAHRRAGRWVTSLQRRPVRIIAAAIALLVVLAAPLTQLSIGRADASADPVGTPARDYYELMTPAFGAGFDATVVLAASTPDTAAQESFATLVAAVGEDDAVAAVRSAPQHPGQQVAIAAIVPTESSQTQETQDLVTELRDQLIPSAQAGTGLEVHVTGVTAANMDIASTLLGNLPAYLIAISLLGFLLLAVAFRSVAVPLIGVVSNLLSIGVGVGVAVAVFQFGWGAWLFGVGGAAPIIYMIPVLVAGVMFGLAMDYQVFLVSRMHEEWTRTRSHATAVRVGVEDTASVIIAAALIMFAVFISFAFTGDRIVSALGLGLAVAVLADAFVIRLTAVPAVMRLLGRRTWWYPRWAERITPHLSIEGSTAAPRPRAHATITATVPQDAVRD